MFATLKEAAQELRAFWLGKRAAKAMEEGDVAKSIKLMGQALRIMEKTFGDIPQTIIYAWDIAEFYAAAEQYEEAESHYQRVLEYVKLNPSSDLTGIPGIPIVIDSLSDVLREMGCENDAKQLYEQLDQIALESEHPLINTQDDLNIILTNYYKTKHVELISSAISFIDKDSEDPIENFYGAAAGFFGEVFRQNPDHLEKWLAEIAHFSERGKQLFYNAYWHCNSPKSRMFIKNLAGTDILEAVPLEWIDSEPPDLRKLVPHDGVEGDMSWGAFLATGDPIFVVNIITAATEYNERENYQRFINASVGKWSLASNAQQHLIVYQTLEKEVNKYEGDKREVIQDILDKSKIPNGPNLIQEETQQVIEDQKSKGKWADEGVISVSVRFTTS